jgi:diacylglycerol kinase family enzyme
MGARIAPLAQLDDGFLDATIVEQRPILSRFWHARYMAIGAPHRAPNVSVRRVTRAVVETDGPMEFHVDGEVSVAEGRIEVRILPGALRVRAARR